MHVPAIMCMRQLIWSMRDVYVRGTLTRFFIGTPSTPCLALGKPPVWPL
jgi:hypothetical protein